MKNLWTKKIILLICGFMVFMSGCGTTSPVASVPQGGQVIQVDPEQQLINNKVTANDGIMPRIKPGMLINISVAVAGETEIYRKDSSVSQQGTIYLPLLKDVEVAGLTIPEAESKIKTLCEQYFKAPQVEISFSRVGQDDFVSPWGYVTVMGNVMSPGSIALPQGRKLHISEAIALAGGFAPSAKARAVRLTRKTISGKLIKKKVNLHAVVAGGRVDEDVELKPGDIIFVPETIF